MCAILFSIFKDFVKFHFTWTLFCKNDSFVFLFKSRTRLSWSLQLKIQFLKRAIAKQNFFSIVWINYLDLPLIIVPIPVIFNLCSVIHFRLFWAENGRPWSFRFCLLSLQFYPTFILPLFRRCLPFILWYSIFSFLIYYFIKMSMHPSIRRQPQHDTFYVVWLYSFQI